MSAIYVVCDDGAYWDPGGETHVVLATTSEELARATLAKSVNYSCLRLNDGEITERPSSYEEEWDTDDKRRFK